MLFSFKQTTVWISSFITSDLYCVLNYCIQAKWNTIKIFLVVFLQVFISKSPMQMRIVMHSFVWNLYNCFSHMAQCLWIWLTHLSSLCTSLFILGCIFHLSLSRALVTFVPGLCANKRENSAFPTVQVASVSHNVT